VTQLGFTSMMHRGQEPCTDGVSRRKDGDEM
jgi:hypothetical protein